MTIPKRSRWVPIGGMALGTGLVALGLYLAPSAAYEIQAPFRALGEQRSATVVAKQTVTRTYAAGGRRRGQKRYEERVVVVQDDRRKVEIGHLVLERDFERLAEGDEVSITLIRGKAATDTLPKGPFYLLTSSVEAGPLDLLGWAFDGRPASGAAVAATIPGVVVLILSGVLLVARRRRTIASPQDVSGISS